MIRIDENYVAHDEYFVRASDTDIYNKATPTFYFSIMQEIAAEHASYASVAVGDLLKEGFTWVIYRTNVKFYESAFWKDTIHIDSWAQRPSGLHCPRIIYGYTGERKIFEAVTLWAIIDIKRKRPVKPEFVLDRLKSPDEKKYFVSPALPPFTLMEGGEEKLYLGEREIKPSFYELDSNMHVNNVSYVSWCLSVLDDDFLSEHEIVSFDVKWIRETYIKDKIKVKSALIEKDGVKYIAQLVTGESGEAVFEAESKWRKRL